MTWFIYGALGVVGYLVGVSALGYLISEKWHPDGGSHEQGS